MSKWLLQTIDPPHMKIVVTTMQQVRELEAHGWKRVTTEVTVTKADAEKGAKQS